MSSPEPLTEAEGAACLRVVREALARRLAGEPLELTVPAEAPSALGEPRGAFVSLYVEGSLRGCIGFPAADQPLALTITQAAVLAGTEDERFPPLTEADLPRLAVEVSVLSPMLPVADPAEIVVGRDGLVVRAGGRSGLLLPQVGERYRWTVERFLAETCRKAGLPGDAWRDPEARVFRFQAQVFSEPGAAG